MKNKSKPKFPPNTWGINFEEDEYAVLVENKTEQEANEIAKKLKEKYNFESDPDITYLGCDKNKLKPNKKKRRNGQWKIK